MQFGSVQTFRLFIADAIFKSYFSTLLPSTTTSIWFISTRLFDSNVLLAYAYEGKNNSYKMLREKYR